MTDEAITELNRKIEVMEASKTQKIQSQEGNGGGAVWDDCPIPVWDWFNYDYRVEPTEPQRLVGFRYRSEIVHSAWHSAHRAGVEFSGAPETAEKVEFIELTPEIKQKLGL